MLDSQNELGSISSLSMKEIIENRYKFFLKCLVEFTRDTIWTICFLFWKVINYSSSFFNRGLLRLFISFLWLLADCVFQRIGLFHIGYQICGHRVHSIPFYLFNVHRIFSGVPSLVSDTSNLCPLSFFFLLAWLQAYLFCWSFQGSSFWFHWFSLLIPFKFIDFCSSYYYLFSSAFFGFNLLVFF